jgi:hypothetical protein
MLYLKQSSHSTPAPLSMFEITSVYSFTKIEIWHGKECRGAIPSVQFAIEESQ